MEDHVKLGNFDFAVYQLEEALKTDIECAVKEQNKYTTVPTDAFLRGRLVSMKEALYWLTGDQKWNLSLEELIDQIKLD